MDDLPVSRDLKIYGRCLLLVNFLRLDHVSTEIKMLELAPLTRHNGGAAKFVGGTPPEVKLKTIAFIIHFPEPITET